MDENPPAAPSATPADKEADRRLRGPALGLLTSSALGILLMAFGMSYYGARWNDPEMGASARQIIVGCTLNLMFCLLVGAGAICMLRRRVRPLALLGAWAAIVPMCGPCYLLAIPFGIWALLVLYKSEIAATFD